MRRLVLLYLVLTGCGFRSSAAANDASLVDTTDPSPIDAAIDATLPPATCWQHWLDHTVVLQDPAPLTALSTAAIERDPWLSEDGLRLYFWRQPTPGTADGYLATRASATDPFTTAAPLDGLDLGDRDEDRVSLARDELMLAVSSNLGGGSPFDIRIATRASRTQPFPTPGLEHLTSVNTADTQHFDPFLSSDGLRLYLAPVPNGVAQHIALASRTAIGDDFTSAILVGVINTSEPGAGDGDPALSLDERVIVFSSNRAGGPGGGDLYYATRANVGQPFSVPALIPAVNGAFVEADPMLAADGCTLYFSSARGGGFDLYTAAVTR